MNAIYTILLLLASNVFMTLAWYGHLKLQNMGFFTHATPLIFVILIDATESDSGGYHVSGVCGFLRNCFWHAAEMEPFCGLLAADCGGVLCFRV